MQDELRCLIAAAIAAMLLTGCERSSTASAPPTARAAAPVAAPDAAAAGPRRIKLPAVEAEHLGIAFSEVTRDGERLIAPYEALLYDPNGGEWVFVSPEPAVFTRSAVTVESIEGNRMVLAKGPEAGTKLVTHGAAELYGIEFGVGK